MLGRDKEENLDPKMQKALDLLEQLDRKASQLAMKIEEEKDILDGITGVEDPNATLDTKVVTDYINTINAVKIGDKEEILIKINSEYDKAIKILKDAIENSDPLYEKQFEQELDRLEANKSTRFDPIAETYKEIAGRLERGEIQRDYFQSKADEKQAEIDLKDKHYKEKYGNIDNIIAVTKKPYEKMQEKVEIQRLYNELKKINEDIRLKEEKLATDTSLSDEEVDELKEKIEELKEKRKEKVEEFAKFATDKDGKPYKKAADKSDKDYINELDENKIQEAIDATIVEFKSELNKLSLEDRKMTLLDKDMRENGEIDLNNMQFNTHKDVEAALAMLKMQKNLWKQKALDEGYDKKKLNRERNDYQEKADSYDEIDYDNGEYLPAANYGTTFKDRFNFNRQKHGAIKSFFKSIFGKAATEEEMQQSYGDSYMGVEDAKKEALKYLTKNRSKLNEINVKDRKKKEFKNKLNYNVRLTQSEVEKFWDKKADEQSRDDDNQR